MHEVTPFRRKEHLIVTVSGKIFQTLGSNKLGLLYVSKVHPRDITALAADSFLVFAAAGSEVERIYYEISSFPVVLSPPSPPPLPPLAPSLPTPPYPRRRRGDELQRVYRGHAATVHLMLPFGPQLLTLDTEGVLKVWDIKTGAEYLEMTFNNENTLVSALCHPSTYIDKVQVGTSQGHLQHSYKLEHQFTSY